MRFKALLSSCAAVHGNCVGAAQRHPLAAELREDSLKDLALKVASVPCQATLAVPSNVTKLSSSLLHTIGDLYWEQYGGASLSQNIFARPWAGQDL